MASSSAVSSQYKLLDLNVVTFCLLQPFIYRLVKQGKGMLQPHQIIAEYNSAIPEADREKLKDSAFDDVLRAAQVNFISQKNYNFT
jgi:Sucrose synthase